MIKREEIDLNFELAQNIKYRTSRASQSQRTKNKAKPLIYLDVVIHFF